ncbi:MAG: MFS transporter [Burkholderiales bacterium]
MTDATAMPAGMKRNLGLLIVAQALLFVNNVTMIAVTGLVGFALAPTAILATIPLTCYVVGAALAAGPVARMMRRQGRRTGFSVGALFGIAGVSLAALGAYYKVFWLLCGGMVIVGVFNACGALYRFAAAEVVSPNYKERAISWVMAGGIVGGVIGPNLAKYSKDFLPVTFAGSYAVLALFALASLIVVRFVEFPAQTAAEKAGGGRPLGEIMRQPVFIVAVLGATIGYGVMNLLMSATPLAMQMCSLPFSNAALVLEWHVIGMFAPSFFTGNLIRRFGVLNIMFTGALLMFACVAFALNGQDLMHFLGALFVLGVGWNFLFIGGTTLLTEAYRPEEKNRVQGVNDFLVFLTMATSSFTSGALVTTRGWEIINMGALPFLVLVCAGIFWLGVVRRRAAAPA